VNRQSRKPGQRVILSKLDYSFVVFIFHCTFKQTWNWKLPNARL